MDGIWAVDEEECALFYYQHLLQQLTTSLFYEGLDASDYSLISKTVLELISQKQSAYWNWSEYVRLHKHIFTDDRVSEKDKKAYCQSRDARREYLGIVSQLLGDFVELQESLERSILPISLGKYLHQECSITHLLYTNNTFPKIKLYSDNSFMFLCQFHLERTPSLGVTNSKGLGHCYGCGASFHTIGYIRAYENMTYREAVSLLARVYYIDIDRSVIEEEHPLVEKYRSALLSDGFRELLERGRERTQKKESTWEVDRALLKYEHDLKTIERVRSGEHLVFTSHQEEKPKRLVLEMPIFSSTLREGYYE